jgi:hypothetical protein
VAGTARVIVAGQPNEPAFESTTVAQCERLLATAATGRAVRLIRTPCATGEFDDRHVGKRNLSFVAPPRADIDDPTLQIEELSFHALPGRHEQRGGMIGEGNGNGRGAAVFE